MRAAELRHRAVSRSCFGWNNPDAALAFAGSGVRQLAGFAAAFGKTRSMTIVREHDVHVGHRRTEVKPVRPFASIWADQRCPDGESVVWP